MLEFKAICTPDYSVYPNMNINDIRFNVYRNRWIGCMLQEKGYNTCGECCASDKKITIANYKIHH